jgi:hypothetical protein
MSDVNGAPAAPAAPIGIVINEAAVQILEKHLAAVRDGSTNTVGVLSVDHAGNTVTQWAGPRLGDLYVGCGTVMHRLMQQFTTPQQPSRILRAR